jgi:haloacid dehalogenase-like hydrolase
MSTRLTRRFVLSILAAFPGFSGSLFRTAALAQGGDPLPSWNEGPARQSILDFVAAVTREGSPGFVPVAERIATFDNDGTLWIEQPMYVQLAFALDRVRTLAPQHPEWRTVQPFKAALEADTKTLAASGERGLVGLIMATHAGMTTDRFESIVTDWLATAQHPRFHRPYTSLVYQPMLELLAYLRANGFKTFIVSGGGIEFMRPWTGQVYGVPPEQVVGSSIKTQFQLVDGRPILMRLPEINFIDDKAGKPVGINEYIGRRPIAAFGNSDGDLEMLQWTTMAGDRRRLGLIVHHTDAEREYAYDRHSQFGRLDAALDAAAVNGWTVVDMKQDWNRIFPEDTSPLGAGSRAIK